MCLPKSFEKLILFRLVDRKTGFGLINSKKLFQLITKPSKFLFLFSIFVLPCLGLVPLGQCYTKESRDSNLRHQCEKCKCYHSAMPHLFNKLFCLVHYHIRSFRYPTVTGSILVTLNPFILTQYLREQQLPLDVRSQKKKYHDWTNSAILAYNG